MHDEAGPLNSPSPGGALPPCCCPLMFCATAGSRPWIDRLSHRFLEVSFADTLRHLVEAYLERTGTTPGALGLDAVRDRDFVRARLAPGVSVRLDTADEVLERIGEPPFGPLFRAEVEAYLAITGTKAYLLGQLGVGDASFVTRLRRGLSPRLDTVDRVRRWMGEHSTAPERRAIAAATLHAHWWRLGAPLRGARQPDAGLPDVRPTDAVPSGGETRATEETAARSRPRRFLTPGEVAGEWATSTRTLARLRADGEGPAYHRFGGRIRYARSDVDEWVAACRVSPAERTTD